MAPYHNRVISGFFTCAAGLDSRLCQVQTTAPLCLALQTLHMHFQTECSYVAVHDRLRAQQTVQESLSKVSSLHFTQHSQTPTRLNAKTSCVQNETDCKLSSCIYLFLFVCLVVVSEQTNIVFRANVRRSCCASSSSPVINQAELNLQQQTCCVAPQRSVEYSPGLEVCSSVSSCLTMS